MESKLSWELLADGVPVRLGCRWLRAMNCPQFAKPGPYIGGPGKLALALSDNTLYYIDLSEWRAGFRKTGIEAASFGPPFRPRRRIKRADCKTFRRTVRDTRRHWQSHLATFGVDLPKPYRNPLQRIGDICFGQRVSAGQIVLASEREIRHWRSEANLRWARETAITVSVPNQLDQRCLGPGKELVAASVIDPVYQAKMGLRGFVHRVWFVDWSCAIDNADYLEGFSKPLDDTAYIVDARRLQAGHESLPCVHPNKLRTLDEYDCRARQQWRDKFLPKTRHK